MAGSGLLLGRYLYLLRPKTGPGPQIIPFPDDLRGQYQAYTCADLSRLRAAGWDKPFLSLEAGMADYWQKLDA